MDKTREEKNSGARLIGEVWGPSSPESTQRLPLPKINITVKEASLGGIPRTTTSDASGKFFSAFLPPGLYEVSFIDPLKIYSLPAFQVRIGQYDKDISKMMLFSGENEENKKEKHNNRTGGFSGIHGSVISNKGKPLPNIEVSIKSMSLDSGKKGFLQKLAGVAFSAIRRSGRNKNNTEKTESSGENRESNEKPVATIVKTNLLGWFFSDKASPDGTYLIACYDTSGKYKFISQSIVVKNQKFVSFLFIGYTSENTGEPLDDKSKKEVQEELDKYKETTGKEVKYTDKTKREAPKITAEQAADKLEAISREQDVQHPVSKEKLIVPAARPAKEPRTGPRIIEEVPSQTLFEPIHTYYPPPVANQSSGGERDNQSQTSQPQSQQQSTQKPSRQPRSESSRRRNLPRRPKMPNTINSAISTVKSAVQKLKWFVNPYFFTFATIFGIAIFVMFFSGGGGIPGLDGGDSGGQNATVPGGQTGTGGTTQGGSCPSLAGNYAAATCKYLNPSIDLFNTNISQDTLNKYIDKYSPTFANAGLGDKAEFTKRANYIVNSSKQAGLNPALFLGYWKSESLFGTSTGAKDMGCIFVEANFYEQVDCALGINAYSNPTSTAIHNCARSGDANSQACQQLKGMRATADLSNPISYPITTFDDFVEAHGPFSHDPDGKKGNCTSTYNVLMEVATELAACAGPSSQPGPVISDNSSCPIPNGVLTCGSFSSPVVNGPLGYCAHCDEAYRKKNPTVNCDAYPWTAKAIDIDGNDLQDIILPSVNGHEIEWTYGHYESRVSSPNQAIKGFGGIDKVTGANYYLQLHHVEPGGDPIKTVYTSGNVGAKICGNCGAGHVHVEIGTGGTTLTSVSFMDAAEFFCGPAV